jgi:hypothetical protein
MRVHDAGPTVVPPGALPRDSWSWPSTRSKATLLKVDLALDRAEPPPAASGRPARRRARAEHGRRPVAPVTAGPSAMTDDLVARSMAGTFACSALPVVR